ncbi:carbohydrate-Binding Module family 48 protein [Sclerotinia borealis F-4128]|uniref:Carbohydrate-Binding Module family 48 protein n=1 Tax=Sclerotinia borealis (strain F-4128) TaxID=1432307 RepID=W9CXP3_SCLBF|nr:carbohydrate-Binding Module family 48 protein [Sclerotinia borealis F-4128]
MGNTPSTNTRPAAPTPHSHSPAPSNHSNDSLRASSTRRDPRNLIHSQRTAARAEPSLAQAHGSNVTHRPRNSQSHPTAQFNDSLPSSGVNIPSAHAREPQMGLQPHRVETETDKIDVRDQPTKPVDVPMPSSNYDTTTSRSHSHSLSSTQPPSIDPYGPPIQDMSYHLTRPPRLPLPIEEEVHTPGSPLIAPADTIAPAMDMDTLDNEPLARRNSALSNTTIDEEDAEEIQIDQTKATVPTLFEWREGGEKVYVTGTIFQWNKKHRLSAVEGEPNLLRAIIHVRPGTHHVRFIQDGIMKCSALLPTTVDFGNNLVNYIEVSADDLPSDETFVKIPSDPIGGPENKPEITQPEPVPAEERTKPKPISKMKPAISQSQFTSEIPQYLIDMDKPEDSRDYRYAIAAIDKLPPPPSLPGFLGKPILNANAPMKDDNSVLTMPNHTVLNHLATSSIKNNVLAVSATTRYKRKYVTTIMYKPTAEE